MCPFVLFFDRTSLCEMLRFLEAERATNICIALCIKGFLHSRWSVEMTILEWLFLSDAIRKYAPEP